MRETEKVHFQLKAMTAAVAALVMTVVLFGLTTFVSHAEEGRVTVASVNIRASADVSSEAVGGAMQGTVLTITGEVTGTDGKVWYQVTFEGDKTGYVRSDLMEKTSGGTATAPAGTTPASSPSTDVTAVQPVSARVTGEQVRVRSNASTSGSIVTTVQRDVVLTVVGTAQDSEGRTWYQVNFSDANGQVTGFVRDDFATPEGEIIPADQVQPEPEVPEVTDPVEPTPTPEPAHMDYEVKLYEDGWYLLDYTAENGGERTLIPELLGSIESYKAAHAQDQAKLKSTKIITIILVVAVILLALTATLLFFKIRDMMDAAYFEEVEKETIRKRQGQRSTGKAPMPTVGDGSRSSGSSQQRTAGGGQTRTGGQARSESGSQQARPAGNGQARPAGSGQQARPAGGTQAKPRPAGSGQAKPGGQARPAGGQARPAGSGSRGQERPAPRSSAAEQQNDSRQSKNFLAEDDEFDFEYLNWDGEDDNE